MVKRVSATEARVHLGELLRTVVQNGEHVIIERGGRPAAVILSQDEYDRFAGVAKPDWLEMVRQTRARFADPRRSETLPDWTELVNDEREKRDAQLLEGVLRHELRAASVDEQVEHPVG